MTTLSWGFPDTVESVVKSRANGPLLAAAAALHIRELDVVVDMTYGRGRFWTLYRPINLVPHDLYVGDGVDFRDLPEKDESVDVVVFDPPYIAGGGTESSTIPDFRDRYGLPTSKAHDGPQTADDIALLYREGISEAERILKPKGRLMVKTMDFVNGGVFHTMRHLVVTEAIAVGMRQVDEFVHYSGTGPSNFADKTQRTSRRAHSFLCIFKKEP